jgi:hypothetical protein
MQSTTVIIIMMMPRRTQSGDLDIFQSSFWATLACAGVAVAVIFEGKSDLMALAFLVSNWATAPRSGPPVRNGRTRLASSVNRFQRDPGLELLVPGEPLVGARHVTEQRSQGMDRGLRAAV